MGDTQFKPKSWAGAGDCRRTGTWTREGREAGLGRERKPGLKRVGDTELKPKFCVGAEDCRRTGKFDLWDGEEVGREMRLGLQRVGDIQFIPKSWVWALEGPKHHRKETSPDPTWKRMASPMHARR